MERKIVILCFLMVVWMSSCKKWLNEKPDDSLFVQEELTDRQGFARALAGVYNQMSSAALYGRELEYGMMDAIAGSWQIDSRHVYYSDYIFDYSAAGPSQRLLEIWSGLYKAIHSCNVIIEQVDNIKTDPFHDLIKGEALGLRAFLHFELLKLFGPVIARRGLDTKAIPYYSSSTRKSQSFLNSRACFGLIEADLQAAKKLLANDPIITVGKDADSNTGGGQYNSLVDRRGIHLNYYAVLALLARKSQWEGNMDEAATRAQLLLDQLSANHSVRFIRSEELFVDYPDLRFTMENIFGLYINDMLAIKADYISIFTVLNKDLAMEYETFLQPLYTQGSGSTSDYRYQAWVYLGYLNQKFVYPFVIENEIYGDKPYYFEAQLINLPEIYFILTEAYLNRDLQKALGFLNRVRINRGLQALDFSTNMSRDRVFGYLMDEVRREYTGEGYLFGYYKHLYHDIYRANGNIPASETRFVFPVPPAELEYNSGN